MTNKTDDDPNEVLSFLKFILLLPQSNDYLSPESLPCTASHFLDTHGIFYRMKMMMKENLRCITFREH